MQRVKRATAVAVLPADPVGGVPGYFPLPNPGGGIPAAVPGYEWYNNVQEELMSVIEGQGLAASGSDRAQLRKAIINMFQSQTATAFTTAGAAPNFTLTPAQPITVYAAGQRFRVKFNVAGNGADVINVSALGNKSLKQYDSTGTKVAPIIAANQLVDIEYDGVDFVLLDPLPSPKGIQVFSASGSFTVPVGVTTVYLTGCGGGGGGAAYNSGTTGGGGGGSGASAYRRSVAVTPGNVVTVTVGSNGSGSAVATASGTAGGTTSFGALLSLGGGAGGASASAGGGGGSASGGTAGLICSGQTGEQYNPINTASAMGGRGGSSMFGGGGLAGGMGTSNAAGGAAQGFGSGGGGGAQANGGVGTSGMLIVEW